MSHRPESHTNPHEPQLRGSVCVSTQMLLLQTVSGGSQFNLHMPSMQKKRPDGGGVALQLLPHAPQFSVSMLALTQIDWQMSCPTSHTRTSW